MKTYSINTLAYIDSFGGLVPCKALEVIYEQAIGAMVYVNVRAKITANRAGYRKGEIVTQRGNYIVPRKQVFIRDGKYQINTQYTWTNNPDNVH